MSLGSDRPLKIALVHAADLGGGAERSTLALHQALRALGHESNLYVGYKHTDEPYVYELKRVQTVPGLLRGLRLLERKLGWQHLFAPGFRRLRHVIEPDTDVVHLQSLWGSSGYADIGALPSLSQHFPTIITLRDQWLMTGHCACWFDCQRWQRGCGQCPDLAIPPAIPRDGTRFNWIRKWIALHRSDVRITAVSDYLRREAKKSPILSGKQINVVYNGIDDSIFRPGDRRQARIELGLPQEAFIVLITGQTLEGFKNGIAQQWRKLLEDFSRKGVRPLLVGHSAEHVARELSMPVDAVHFLRAPHEMARCYAAADVTMVCSEVETFGRIAAESQACGTPVIAFATGGLPEVVIDGVGGIIVPKADVLGLEEALKHMIARPEERRRMGQEGRKWAIRQFSHKRIAEEFVSQYRQVIADRRQ